MKYKMFVKEGCLNCAHALCDSCDSRRRTDFWLIMDDGEIDDQVFYDEDSANEYRARTLQDEVIHVQRYQPVLEVIDGVMKDKSQDADWLRLRYFELRQQLDKLMRPTG